MTTNETLDSALPPDAIRQMKAAHRQMWALGDYHRFATSTVWELGAVLVEACGISTGERVLDVAAGTGNVAIRAARRGAMTNYKQFIAAASENAAALVAAIVARLP